jgi:hypothetical protein
MSDGRSVRTPDGGQRPVSSLILGVVNALEPKLGNLMVPFFRLNADEDAIVTVLELHFDPDIELGNTSSNTVTLASGETEVSGLLPDSPEHN